ncbi:hypothetical protein CR513_03142, partial [Mucuna pruriens]
MFHAHLSSIRDPLKVMVDSRCSFQTHYGVPELDVKGSQVDHDHVYLGLNNNHNGDSMITPNFLRHSGTSNMHPPSSHDTLRQIGITIIGMFCNLGYFLTINGFAQREDHLPSETLPSKKHHNNNMQFTKITQGDTNLDSIQKDIKGEQEARDNHTPKDPMTRGRLRKLQEQVLQKVELLRSLEDSIQAQAQPSILYLHLSKGVRVHAPIKIVERLASFGIKSHWSLHHCASILRGKCNFFPYILVSKIDSDRVG